MERSQDKISLEIYYKTPPIVRIALANINAQFRMDEDSGYLSGDIDHE